MGRRYVRAEMELEGLDALEHALLVAIAEHADDETGIAWPGNRLLAKESRISERHLRRVLERLVNKKIVAVTQGVGKGHYTTYKLLFSPAQSSGQSTSPFVPISTKEDTTPQLSSFVAVIQSLKEDIQSLKEDMASLKEDIQSLKEDMASLKEDIQSLKEDIQSLKEDMASLKEDIQSLKEDMASLKEGEKGTERGQKGDTDMPKRGQKGDSLSRKSVQPITIEPITIEPIKTTTTTTAESSLSSSSESSSDVPVEEKTPEPITEPISSMADVSKLRKIDTGFDAMCAIYENEIEKITPLLAKEIYGLRSHPPGWWRDAIGVAAKAGRDKRKLSYIKGILSNWQAEGKNNGTNLRSSENSFSSKQQLAGSVSNDEYAHLSA